VVVEEIRSYCWNSFIAFRFQTSAHSPSLPFPISSFKKQTKKGSPLATEMDKRGDPFADIEKSELEIDQRVLHELHELYATITEKRRRTHGRDGRRCSAIPKVGWMNQRLKK
jgi:hypothetical protein